MFSNPKFRTLYFSEQPSSNGRIRTHVDTEDFRSHRLFNEFSGAVRIQIFSDDLEVVNPCGSKTTNHQQAMFCFTIINLPPCSLSQLPHIHPFAIYKTLDVVEDNFVFVIREFMFELHELESKNGMLLDVADLADFRIRETLVSVCADTKGAHEIGGFMSLSAKKFCRLCLIEHPEINFKRRIDDLVLRDRNNYDEAVVASNSDVNEIPKTEIKYSSLLN